MLPWAPLWHNLGISRSIALARAPMRQRCKRTASTAEGLNAEEMARAEQGKLVVSRVIRRLIPFIFLCYVIAYIDRVNIGFAANQLQRDLGLSDAAYGWGAGLFFLGYCLFEIPSNLILDRVGARLWIARIMIGWGLMSMAMMFVWDKWSFYGARVLLGIAEAGFFPGMVLYLTYWIPVERTRPRRRAVHDGRADRDDRRRARLGSAARAERRDGPPRLAVAVPGRRPARGGARRRWRCGS